MNLTDFNIPLICWISFILLIWFESDIVQTISKLTNARNLLKMPEFEKYKLEEDIMSTYPNFLYEKYSSNLTKLLSCPICLCFWLTLFSVNVLIYVCNYELVFAVLLFPINYISSLILYLILKKLL